MLRKLLLSSIAAATVAGSALAADLPSRKAPPPAFVPPPVMTWTGLYVGVNGGAIWTNSRNFITTGTDFGGVVPGAGPISAASALASTGIIPTTNRAQFLVGGTWGYNWQWNQWVLGTESDFQGVFGCRNDNNNNFGFFGNNNNNACGGIGTGVATAGVFTVTNQQLITRSLDYLSTSRVRAGFLVTPSLLVYGTGGVALGKVRVNSGITSTLTPALIGVGVVPGLSTFNYSQLKAGFTAGGGLEWMFFKDWSFKAEALYYDLGRSSLNQQFQVTAGGGLFTNTGTQTTWRNNGVIARAGLNYHIHWFDAAPVVARY